VSDSRAGHRFLDVILANPPFQWESRGRTFPLIASPGNVKRRNWPAGSHPHACAFSARRALRQHCPRRLPLWTSKAHHVFATESRRQLIAARSRYLSAVRFFKPYAASPLAIVAVRPRAAKTGHVFFVYVQADCFLPRTTARTRRTTTCPTSPPMEASSIRRETPIADRRRSFGHAGNS